MDNNFVVRDGLRIDNIPLGDISQDLVFIDGSGIVKAIPTNTVFSSTTITGYNKTNWDSAYGWGDHALVGYLTELPAHTHNYLSLAGGTLTGEVYFQDDGEGITFNGGARIYKKVGGGLTLRRNSTDIDPVIENNAGTSSWTIWHTGNLTNLNQLTTRSYSDLQNIPSTFTATAHTHTISDITGLQTALNDKVDDSQVLTNVPAGALFTDTIYELPFADNSSNWNTAYGWGNHAGLYSVTGHTHTISNITGLQTALNDKVDDSQVLTNVPAGALFTDTVYELPFADNSSNWNTAFGWGNHALAGYLTTESDSQTLSWTSASGTLTISGGNSVILDGRYSLLGHNHSGVYEPVFTKLTGFNKNFGSTAGTVAQGNDSRILNGQTAFGWGDHALAGYLTSYTDTTYTSSNGILLTGTNFTPTYGTGTNTIAQGNDSRIINGQTAFSWGNHAGLYSLTGHTHDDRYFTETESDARFAPSVHTHPYLPLSGGTLTGTLIVGKALTTLQSDWLIQGHSNGANWSGLYSDSNNIHLHLRAASGALNILLRTDDESTFTLGVLSNHFKKIGGLPTEFLKADGTIDSNTYLTSYTETDTLDTVVSRGSSTATGITTGGLISNGNIEMSSGWLITSAGTRVGIGGLPTLSSSPLQIHGSVDIDDGGMTFRGGGVTNNVLYTGGAETFILRNFGTEPSTLFEVRSKAGNPTSDIREATIALTRTDDAGNAEFLDLYNNGYHTGNPASVQYGLRIQSRGTGQIRPFVFDWYDGTTYTDGYKADIITGFTYYKDIEAPAFIKTGGAPTEFLKADGSIDSTAYLASISHDTTVRTIDISSASLPVDYTEADIVAYLNTNGFSKTDIETLIITVDGGAEGEGSYTITQSDNNYLHIDGSLPMSGDIIPDVDNVHSLGSLTKMWRDIYVGPGSLYVNGKKVIEDVADTMNITTSLDQNLAIKTSGVGTLQISALGSGNVELNAVSGLIQLKGTTMFQAQKLIRTTDGTPLLIDDDMNFSLGTGISSDLDVSGAVTGSALIKSGASGDDVLLGDGTTTSLAAIGTTYTSSNGIVLTGSNFAPTYGTTLNTIAQGNDSRILNGQTAFGWGNHAGLYDNYGSWNLKSNGIQRTTIQSGGSLDLVGGTNVSISYGAGGVMTFDAIDTNTQLTQAQVGTFATSEGFIKTYSETDTLDSVTGRGATTSNAITTGDITASYLNTSGGLNIIGGTNNFRLYNNPGSTVIYMRDTTNANMLTTWGPSYFTSHYKIFGEAGADITGVTTSGSFVKSGGTADDVLLGDGTTTSLAGLGTTYTSSNGILLTGSNFTPTYGTTLNTIAQGNDSRINNGQTAFGWGNHASAGYSTTDTNTTYTGGSGITLTGTVFSATYGTAAGTIAEGNHTHPYLPLSGGTVTGLSTFNNGIVGVTYALSSSAPGVGVSTPIWNISTTYPDYGLFYVNESVDKIQFKGAGVVSTTIGLGTGGGVSTTGTVTAAGGDSTQWNTAFGWGNHAGLYSLTGHTHSYLPLSGGTLTGALTLGGILTNTSTASRDKLRVWSSNLYTIGMDTSYTFGAINSDYAMTFQMNNASNRGFWWGDDGHTNAQGAMSLSTDGKLSVAYGIRVGYGEGDTTVPGATYRLDVSGSIFGTSFVKSGGTADDILLGNGTTTSLAAIGGGLALDEYVSTESSTSVAATPTVQSSIDVDTITNTSLVWANSSSLNIPSFAGAGGSLQTTKLDSGGNYYATQLWIGHGADDEIGFRKQTSNAWSPWQRISTQSWANGQFLGATAKAADSELLDGINSIYFMRTDTSDTFLGKLSVGTTSNRSAGMYGKYDANYTGHIWSMGTAYSIPDNGANFGNLYGIAYKHTNNTTGGTMAGGHQAVYCNNGTPGVAIGFAGGVWSSENMQAPDFVGTSDETLKENIEQFKPNELKSIYKRFNFIGNEQPRIGVIAQELEMEHPEFVRTNEDGIKSVSYNDLHSAEIAYLKSENEELKTRLAKLETLIDKLI